MTATTGTPRARALAAALRTAREATKISVRAVAKTLDISHSVVSYWETGKRVPSSEDTASFLTAIGVTGEQRERILEIARRAGEEDWLTAGIPGVSQQLAGVMECERTATAITEWSPLIVPGMLQTSDYARAIIGAGDMPGGQVEAKVALRMSRRDVLTRREPSDLVALISEAALHQIVGDHSVMADQLRHLAKTSETPTVTLQVLPDQPDWHPGLMGPFLLYEFADSPAIVHLEHHRSGVFLYGADDVDAYKTAAETIRRAAMSPARTAELIAEVADKMETTQ
ncbi:MAG: helix-turn-helix domain-containing protein [Sciscionella sp.]